MEFIEENMAVMEPDCYAGDSCDQVKPRWVLEIEKEGRVPHGNLLELLANTFPPGTKVTINIPLCPKCGTSADSSITPNGMEDCDCGFDWKNWCLEQFS